MRWHRWEWAWEWGVKSLLACVILSCMAGCAHQDEWTRSDTIRQVVLYTVMTADAYSTRNIQYDNNVREIAPLAQHVLGAQPKTSDTWQYFIAAGTIHYLIARSLPTKWRTRYQRTFTIGHSYYVINNAELGLFKRTQLTEPFIGPICQICRPISSQ